LSIMVALVLTAPLSFAILVILSSLVVRQLSLSNRRRRREIKVWWYDPWCSWWRSVLLAPVVSAMSVVAPLLLVSLVFAYVLDCLHAPA
jgi:hypothetical protein